MDGDVFGSLLDWGRVMRQIAELRKAAKLDEHQEGLRRVLRYPDNWRLRETVLKAIKDLRAPSEGTLSEAHAIMMDGSVYWEVRALAADALSHVIGKKAGLREGIGADFVRKVVEGMNAILATPQPPLFRASVGMSLEAIQEGL